MDSTVSDWFLYILECRDGTFYTGITKDLEQRLQKHNEGVASKYTRVRLPVKLIYQESGFDYSRALKREREVKALSRREKEALLSK
ncbi:MAG: GIY-YIG nuclease family protein [bacterium]